MANAQTLIKLQIPAGQANPAPPVGTALGPTGVNIQEFCQQFNDKTSEMRGDIIPVVITIAEDRSFTFELKTPPAAALLKKLLKLKKGSGRPNTEKIGPVSEDILREIAEIKMVDLNTDDIEQAMRIIAGTARQMGLELPPKFKS